MTPGRGGRPPRPAGPAQPPAGSTVVPFPGRSVRRRRAVRWAVAGAVAALLGALAWVLLFSPVLAVDEVDVTGTRHVSAEAVQERLAPLHGVPLPRVGSSAVRELVGDLPGVAEVRVVAHPPTRVEAAVREHEARARRGGEAGVDLLLDDGTVLAGVPAERVEGESLPEFSEELSAGPRRDREEVAAVLAGLPAPVAERVESVDSSRAGQVRLGLRDGVVLVWGDAEDAELKGTVATAFLEGDQHGSRAGGVREVDVSVPTRPITR